MLCTLPAGADGSGMDIDTGNATLEALGIKDFDTTGRFSIKTIDDALRKFLRIEVISEHRAMHWIIRSDITHKRPII